MLSHYARSSSLRDYTFGAGGLAGVAALSGDNDDFDAFDRPLTIEEAREALETYLHQEGEMQDFEDDEAFDAFEDWQQGLLDELSDDQAMRAIMEEYAELYYDQKHGRSCAAWELALILLDEALFKNCLNRLTENEACSALALAVDVRCMPAIRLLTPKQMVINMQDDAGRTALHQAAKARFSEGVAELLSNSECDASIQDKKGVTALMDAVMAESEASVRLLLPRSKLDAVNREGKTAADLARDKIPALAIQIDTFAKMLLEQSVLRDAANAANAVKCPPRKML